jgi:hypothetical protein
MKNITINAIKVFNDWEWHSNIELNNLIWWRFGWVIYNLKKKWFEFEKTGRKPWDKAYTEYFRLVTKPLYKIYHDRIILLDNKPKKIKEVVEVKEREPFLTRLKKAINILIN